MQNARHSLTLGPALAGWYLFNGKGFVPQHRPLGRAKEFVFRNFERLLVLLVVASLLVINSLIEQKFAFLSFYYLPIIMAGFYGGRRFAVFAGLFIGALVFFLDRKSVV